MVEKFELTNAIGISVGINNFKLMSYTPTGLGVKFNNNYNNYQTYFKLTKQSLSQGQFNAKILFGSVVSETFDSFQKFSEFLAYQPYTMTYTSDSGTWNREAMLSEMTKSEIGSSSYDPNLLDESFTLEFINNWYNNKSAEYKSYDPDPNLGTYGKIYRPKYDQYVNRNLLLDSLTQTKSGTWPWGNGGWTEEWGTYLGSKIYRTPLRWDNARYSYKDLLDRGVINTTDDFTYSVYFRVVGEDPAGMSYASIKFISEATTKDWNVPVRLTSLKEGEWTRIVVTFKFKDIKYDPARDYQNSIRVEVPEATRAPGARYEFAAPKLERGNTATDWTPAPEDKLAIPFEYAYAPYYVYQESNRPSNEKVMSLNNKSQYFGLQSGSPSVITVKGPCSVNPTWTVVQKGNVVATDGFALKLTDNQQLVVSSHPEDQYARLYNPDGSYVDVSQLQDYTKTNFVQIPEGESTVLFYLDADSDVNITFKEERLLV